MQDKTTKQIFSDVIFPYFGIYFLLFESFIQVKGYILRYHYIKAEGSFLWWTHSPRLVVGQLAFVSFFEIADQWWQFKRIAVLGRIWLIKNFNCSCLLL